MSFTIEEFKNILKDLESMNLVKIEHDIIYVNESRVETFIFESIDTLIKISIEFGKISDLLQLTDEAFLYTSIIWGLYLEIVLSRLKLGLNYDDARNVDREYLHKISITYLSIIQKLESYKLILQATSKIKKYCASIITQKT